MTQRLPPELMDDHNRDVLTHIGDLSAHSDVAEALTTAVEPLGDVQTYCPDWEAFRYVIVSTKGLIFGFAVGQNTIAFRLDERMRSRALATGASDCPECGNDWVSFTPFRDDWPKVDLEFWARKAYVYARETVE